MVGAGPVAMAAPEPLPIQIGADHAVVSRSAGVSTYTGDVVLTRGDLTLRGRELTVSRDPQGAIRAVLVGDPARIERSPNKAHPEPIEGHARRLTYNAAEQLLELSGDAYIERGGDALRGATIRHYLASGRTEAASGDDTRVRIIIQPETLSQSPAQSDSDGR